MDDTEKNFAGEEYEPQNIEDITPDENLVTGNGAEQQDAGVNDHQLHLNGNDSEPLNATEVEKDGNDAVPVQNHAENESEQNLPEMEVKPESPENDSKEEFNENDQSETKEPDEEMHHEEGVEHGNDLPAGTEDKKWPGWPGESVFRMLVPAQKVGNIIGRKGEYIKKIVEETRARIKILDGPPGTAERAVMVSAREEPDSSFPPAMDGLLRVHQRIVDGLEGDPAQVVAAAAAKVSTKLLVPASQAGSLIGKQGATVKSIQETSNCIVRVLGSEDLPVFALQDDRVVEVVGEPAAVHKAMELIAAQLRKFLVDRSIIPLFEMQMQNPTKHNHMDHHMPPHQPSWGPPPHHGHGLPPSAGGYGSGSQYMPPPPRQMDSYYPPPDMAPPPAERQPHHGISAYGRDTPMGGPPSSNSQSAPSMITQITQHMQVPLSYADAVIGASGSNISYIRRASGATVTIQETRGVPGEMTVEISGSASQVQAAQQLIQNFMAGAGGPAPTQSGAPTDQGSYNQGYSSYGGGAPGSTYGSPPSSAGYASQGGGYGSVYGSNYGY